MEAPDDTCENRPGVTRPKTISDEDLLAAARSVFRAQGRTATTRAIAREAGISEGILYQRFGSKEGLFVAAMSPRAPDIPALLGPEPRGEDVPAFLRGVLARLGRHFAEVIPLAIQVIAHPAADLSAFEHAHTGLGRLHGALAARLARFEHRGLVRRSTSARAARLLMSLAHDWALGRAGLYPGGSEGTADLEAMADLVWNGIGRRKKTRTDGQERAKKEDRR
jgi:AcrR family transcriptional regulator